MFLDSACLELGLEIQPDKCTSLHLTGKKMFSKFIIQLRNSQTKPLSDVAVSFLGCTIVISSSETKASTSSKLLKRMMSCLENIGKRPVGGEFKVWIYHFYLVQSGCGHAPLVFSAENPLSRHQIPQEMALSPKKCNSVPSFRTELSKHSCH